MIHERVRIGYLHGMMNTAHSALTKLSSSVHGTVESMKDFGLPDRRLFPLDTPELTAASVGAFEREHHKLATAEKLSCARAITEAAAKFNVDNRGMAAKLASTKISDVFHTFMNMRAESTAWNPTAIRELNSLRAVGEKIASMPDDPKRSVMITKLAASVDDFDGRWDRTGIWRERGMPDAAYSVVGPTMDPSEPMPLIDYVKVGGRQVRASDLTPEVLAAAAVVLGDDVKKIASLKDFSEKLDEAHQQIVVSFMSGV